MKLEEALANAKEHVEHAAFCQGLCVEDLIEAVEEHLKNHDNCGAGLSAMREEKK